jgi:ABC-2 type transport system permease protein
MSDAVIVDRGYRSYEGARRGRRGAFAAVVREGVRRELGLRRKASRKILPWLLISMALISMAVVVGLHWAVQRFGVSGLVASQLPSYGQYFDTIATISMLFVAFATPQLLIPDRREGVLAVYFSRPLLPVDYLGAKYTALGLLVMGFYLVPEFVLHIALAALSPDGFFSYLGSNLDVIWKIVFVAFVFFVAYASIAFIVSALVGRTGIAAGVFLGIMIIFNQIVSAVVRLATFPGARYAGLLAVQEQPRVVRDWVFGISTGDYAASTAGFEPWVSLVAIGIIFVAVAGIVWDRYRRLS